MEKEQIKLHIIALEKAALNEWNKGNPSEYIKIMAPEITYFDPLQEKRIDGLENMTTLYESLRGKICAEQSEMINPVVEVGDNIAVLSYNLNSYSNGVLYKWNCTEVFKLYAAEWKIIHNHWSLVRPMDMKNL